MNICGYEKLKNQKGATAVYVAIVLVVLFMFTALGIDVGHLYGVRNELHNAADAAALAGAANLFDDLDGSLTRQAAIDEAMRIAALNRTGNQAVAEIIVETGHWSFMNQEFTPNPTDTQMDWQELSFSELDGDINFINAVRVQVDRSATPSFFAGIFGFESFLVNNDAVAYIGFAGTIYPGELDQPIAICKEAITDDDSYSCNMGRMLNSGVSGNPNNSHNTGGWTNFEQPDTCTGGANTPSLRPLVCGDGNPEAVSFGEEMESSNGVVDNVFEDFYDCWRSRPNGMSTNWSITLPVIECPGNSIPNCAKVVGAVTVDVVWVNYHVNNNTNIDNHFPQSMTIDDTTWNCSSEDGVSCWAEFVQNYNLTNVDNLSVEEGAESSLYQSMSIYFLPSCTPHEPTGNSGGQNFGILAKIPKLVE